MISVQAMAERIMDNNKIDEYQRAFELLEPTEGGVVTKENLEHFLWALGYRPTHTEVCYIVADATEGSALKLPFRGFLHVFSEPVTFEEEEKELLEAFRIFDKNRDGFICSSELRFLLSKLGLKISEEEADGMIAEVDTDGDGRVSYEEFKEAIKLD